MQTTKIANILKPQYRLVPFFVFQRSHSAVSDNRNIYLSNKKLNIDYNHVGRKYRGFCLLHVTKFSTILPVDKQTFDKIAKWTKKQQFFTKCIFAVFIMACLKGCRNTSTKQLNILIGVQFRPFLQFHVLEGDFDEFVKQLEQVLTNTD